MYVYIYLHKYTYTCTHAHQPCILTSAIFSNYLWQKNCQVHCLRQINITRNICGENKVNKK